MKHIAKVRLILFVIVTLVIGCFFFFEPALNMGSPSPISMYHEIKQGQPLLPIIIKEIIILIAVFFGLVFLIGLKEKPKDRKNKKDNKDKK